MSLQEIKKYIVHRIQWVFQIVYLQCACCSSNVAQIVISIFVLLLLLLVFVNLCVALIWPSWLTGRKESIITMCVCLLECVAHWALSWPGQLHGPLYHTTTSQRLSVHSLQLVPSICSRSWSVSFEWSCIILNYCCMNELSVFFAFELKAVFPIISDSDLWETSRLLFPWVWD